MDTVKLSDAKLASSGGDHGKLRKYAAAVARAVNDNPWRALAFTFGGIIVSIVAWALWDGIETDKDHDMRITALENTQSAVLIEINRRLGAIEDELRERR